MLGVDDLDATALELFASSKFDTDATKLSVGSELARDHHAPRDLEVGRRIISNRTGVRAPAGARREAGAKVAAIYCDAAAIVLTPQLAIGADFARRSDIHLNVAVRTGGNRPLHVAHLTLTAISGFGHRLLGCAPADHRSSRRFRRGACRRWDSLERGPSVSCRLPECSRASGVMLASGRLRADCAARSFISSMSSRSSVSSWSACD